MNGKKQFIESSVPFVYPEEEDEEEDSALTNIEFIERLLSYILPARNPRLALASICFACGINISTLLNCEPTITSIATALGVSKGCFSKSIKKVTKEFNIVHLDTGKDSATQDIYKNRNKYG